MTQGALDPATRGEVRAARPGDIPALVSLRQRAFRLSERSSASELAAYFRTVFFANPWREAGLPSLVHENERGEVTGFLGVLPRLMAWQGRTIRVAVGTQLMAAPGEPGMIGRRLARAFIDGPQDLSLGDAANDAAQRLWRSVGGRVPATMSLTWTRTLRPSRRAIDRRRSRGLRRIVQAALTPVAAAIDFVTRSQAVPEVGPSLHSDTLTTAAMRGAADKVFGGYALRPVYGETDLTWLLARAAEKRHFGPLHSGMVRSGNCPRGWFMYHLGASRVATVLQVAASERSAEDVLRTLLAHAWSHRAVEITGRVEPWMLRALTSTGAVELEPGPWTLLHSRNPAIATAIEDGSGYLSRLDGEWWLSF